MKILMCRPDFFGVEYEINPWMHVRNQVDQGRAASQWAALHSTYILAGHEVVLEAPVKGLPDMVFSANAGLVLGTRAVLRRFHHQERQGEEKYWHAAFERLGYEVIVPPDGMRFEGAGDGLFVGDVLFAGHGFRTDLDSHAFVAQRLGVETISLRLVDDRFYHLDTCLCPLAADVVMFAPGAFDSESAEKVRASVAHVIEVPIETAAGFACNAMPMGDTVVSSQSLGDIQPQLKAAGFNILTLPMTEFQKAGGGVRCLTLPLGG
ncbi:MAG: dimethylarginine dimethylaminohydrolase family protein [Candidatus Dormibacteria bacterium]